jgi:hypothetical protein
MKKILLIIPSAFTLNHTFNGLDYLREYIKYPIKRRTILIK